MSQNDSFYMGCWFIMSSGLFCFGDLGAAPPQPVALDDDYFGAWATLQFRLNLEFPDLICDNCSFNRNFNYRVCHSF